MGTSFGFLSSLTVKQGLPYGTITWVGRRSKLSLIGMFGTQQSDEDV